MLDRGLDEDLYGKVTLESLGEYIAGSHASFTLIYTAGKYGMDDLGGLKLFFHYACDQSPLQTKNPRAVGYTTATASNGAKVSLSYFLREGKRPWYKMLRVRIEGKGLKEGDSITIKLGDTSQGSPGFRLQTFCAPSFVFRTAVDVFSTNVFILLPSPQISIVSGPPERWKAVLPTLRLLHETFDLKIRAEDRWGNPSDKAECELVLKPSIEIKGLPNKYKIEQGKRSHIIKDLELQEFNKNKGPINIYILHIDIFDSNSNFLTRTNPLILKATSSYKQFWGDLHGQSEETIGTNTAEMYFKFARDLAFLDVIGHQGNDFQVTSALWNLLNDLSEKYYQKHEFVPLFGYEYSANTALGGDRNVYFLKPYRQIHRSSHALIQQETDLDTDCLTASELFSALIADNPDADESVLVIAHVGGRYADILNHHDGRIEHSVEIHSEWGTFEWLLFDAFDKGYRMGIVANSDDHKGRPGVAYPGASKFGTQGGLTCFLISELTREHVFNALKQRHHYATTGERIFLEIKGSLNQDCIYHEKDPSVYLDRIYDKKPCKIVQMGDIIEIPVDRDVILTLSGAIISNAPIERIDIFNGKQVLKTIRPYVYADQEIMEERIKISLNEPKNDLDIINDIQSKDLSRIRVRWEGAEFRARKRNTSWKGTAKFKDNEIVSARSFNFWNIDAPLNHESMNKLSWDTITSGNFQGFDVELLHPFDGKLIFRSSQINFELPINDISIEDNVFEIGGVGKKVRVYRYPKHNLHTSFAFQIDLPLKPIHSKDEKIFVRVTLENGHQAWSSPMYFFKQK
ncbi:MAG: DUF3604 domain-containing protein [Promethearchaeota archaeon]|nr:MAG: DUF3604 domain-containing protein [Candidatus Lokiarchaeota archaeon]